MPSLLPLSVADRDNVLRLFDAQGLMHAVVYVRRVTGADLADANLTVCTLLQEAERLRPPGKKESSARILAFGPYRRDILPRFDIRGLPSHKATREGVPVVVSCHEVYDSDEDVRALAACFQADPWDFNTHVLDPWRANLEALRALGDGDDGEVDEFMALRDAGFQFHFQMEPEEDPVRELQEAFKAVHACVLSGTPVTGGATRSAFPRLLPLLPPSPRVFDLGCGLGGDLALALARELAAHITWVDWNAPYLEQLKSEAVRQGLGHLCQTQHLDPRELEAAPDSVDLLWFQGSLRVSDWAEGLRRWRPLLRPGGLLAVTEATWLPDAPPPESIDVWFRFSHRLGTVAAHRAMAHEAGYEVLETVVLPTSAWWDEHYRLLKEHVASLRERIPWNDTFELALEMSEREISLHARHGEAYGHVLYLLRALEQGRTSPRSSGA